MFYMYVSTYVYVAYMLHIFIAPSGFRLRYQERPANIIMAALAADILWWYRYCLGTNYAFYIHA